MNKVLLISPHYDDAVLSAGQFMAGRPDTDVLTVFGGYPPELMKTDYDKKCGFNNSTEAMFARENEDKEATALLKANSLHLNYLDNQYNTSVNVSKLAKDILKQINDYNYEFVIAPLGVGHPDHILVSDTVISIMKDIGTPLYLWEDLPLRVVQPELVQERLHELGLTELISIGTGPIADKIRALSCYRSQIGTGILDPYIMYVPERFWKV